MGQIAQTFGVDWPHLAAQVVSFSIVCALLYWLAYKRVLDMLEMLGDEVDIDRGLELYGEMLPMDEHVAATVANRVIARHDSPGGARGRYSNVFRDPGRK